MSGIASETAAYVASRLHRLRESAAAPAVRSELARLRRGVGKAPGSMPELWQATLGEMPQKLMGTDSAPSKSEWAAYTALTLYALHQQGRDITSDCMYRPDETLGVALRRLAIRQGGDERVKRRFDAMATSGDMYELANHMRGIVQLLRAEGLPLDYAALAQDLYIYQYPDSRDGVRLRWGRDFYRRQQSEETNTNEATVEER